MVFLFSFAERLIYPAVGPVERGGNSVFEFSTLSTGRHFHRAFLSLFSERNDAESTFLATCARFPSGSFGALFVFWFSWGLVLTQNFAPGGPREEDFGVPRPEMPLLLAPSCPRAFCTSAAAHLDAVSVVHWSVENAVGQVGHGDQEPTRFRPERRLLTPERL